MQEINGHLDDQFVITIEQFFRFKLPQSYKLFLYKSNGGVTKNKFFLLRNNVKEGSVLDRLFGLTAKQYYNMLVYYRDYSTRIPINTLPIGCDPGGNIILLSVKGEDYGKVYFWDHEMETDPPDYSNLTLIADSFDEFINGLKSEEEMKELNKK